MHVEQVGICNGTFLVKFEHFFFDSCSVVNAPVLASLSSADSVDNLWCCRALMRSSLAALSKIR